MFKSILRLIFGTVNERKIREIQKNVDEINKLEPVMQALNDDELRNQTHKLRKLLEDGKTLDEILPEAFATVREVSFRMLNMRHFDVQLIGGIVLHRGMITEMGTGEGKTLVAPLAAYLNALSGKGTHIITINDYLALRDSAWMGKIFEFLLMSVGCIVHGLDDEQRKHAYNCDITYGTNNEFGFDYLRDNMKFSLEEMVQRDFNFAIIDEVDSILIDEARTPLVISGPTEDNSELYVIINKIIPMLSVSDYAIDEKSRTVTLTEDGTDNIEILLRKHKLLQDNQTLYDMESVSLVHHVNQALRAHKIFKIDVDYMLSKGQVMIIDEFTGRALEGRRYSEGLHQALEAKENVKIQNENQTLASITFQNYFRLYPKLSGMTGTAMTEAEELFDIYKLEVLEIPTNKPKSRIDEEDEIYATEKEKYNAIILEIEKSYQKGQPILVGTVSIEKSESLSIELSKRNIIHNVLNARYHEQEAAIIAQAGRFKAVTIATNMAGRGTDIMLGGNPEMLLKERLAKSADIRSEEFKKIRDQIYAQTELEKQKVIDVGGLFVFGTERHESRRIDNQLRGRCGRQGDPGRTKFYLSLEDDLMRIFASERLQSILQKLGLTGGEAIQHPMISRALERAQKKVEARNYDIRKTLLKFDDVANDQRKVIYEQRKDLMSSNDIKDTVSEMYRSVNEKILVNHIPENSYPEKWDIEGMRKEIFRIYGSDPIIEDWQNEEGISEEKMFQYLNDFIANLLIAKEKESSAEIIRVAEKRFLLFTLDQLWKDHLHSLDHLRQGINLRAYGQKDPLNEYKRESFNMFNSMLVHLKDLFIERIFHMQLKLYDTENGTVLYDEYHTRKQNKMFETRQDPANVDDRETLSNNIKLFGNIKKTGRNELCPCKSGKKYKHCHGLLT